LSIGRNGAVGFITLELKSSFSVTVRHHPAAAADRCATATPRHASPYILQNSPQNSMQNHARNPDLLFVRTHEPSVGSNIITQALRVE
jgi:hypothetical protein